jgi:hypothetical protein
MTILSKFSEEMAVHVSSIVLCCPLFFSNISTNNKAKIKEKLEATAFHNPWKCLTFFYQLHSVGLREAFLPKGTHHQFLAFEE